MAEVEVRFAVYGEAVVFSVEIARDASVRKLMEAIYETGRFRERFSFPVYKLKLYLARKPDGAWLTSGPSLTGLLRGEVDTTFPEMDPTLSLSDDELLGPGFEPPRRAIQVLVALPADAAGVESDRDHTMQQMIEASMTNVLNRHEEKRSVYSMSDLNAELAARIRNKMHLRDEYIDNDEPEDMSIGGYQWIPHVAESEDTQREGYMSYLKLHLKALLGGGDFKALDVANDKSVLSIVDARLPFDLNGTADVLLVKRRARKADALAGIRMVIELKKEVDSSHKAQALGQLTACSLKAPLHCYPMSLLTNLNDEWRFMWFNEASVVAYTTLSYPKNAFDFIVAALKESEGSVFRVPVIPRPLKKMRIDDFLPRPSDAADELMERYELMADELEPEFLAERRAEYAQHLVQTMPMYAHVYA